MSCRICLEDTGVLVSPCACKGSAGYVHQECLEKWVHTEATPKLKCEICHNDYYATEICSFQPVKYCTNCLKCKVSAPYHFKTISKVFGMTLCLLAWSPYDYYFIASSITTIVCCLCLIVNTYASPEKIHEHCNYIVSLKCAFSLALWLVLLASYYVIENNCEYKCLAEEKTCNSLCSEYDQMLSHTMVLDYTGMIDIVNLCLIITIRALLLCSVYMRKSIYQNLMEDRERLLSSDCNSSSSLSSSSASGEV